MEIQHFWNAVLRQDAQALRACFWDDAWVNWHCTNEHFTVEEYLEANCTYPGRWDGAIERIVAAGDTTIVVGRVYLLDRSRSFHVVSFLQLEGGKIRALDEYWSDDGPPPQWRLEKKLGTPII